MSKDAGIAIDPKTNGPIVYENMETSIEGIFASGNVVHVHDLVDFVSAESELAGASAGRYVNAGAFKSQRIVNSEPGNGVGYVVPQKVRVDNAENCEFFFRVRQVEKDVKIIIKDQQKVIAKFKREHMAPGEMEKVMLPKVLLDRVEGNTLTFEISREE